MSLLVCDCCSGLIAGELDGPPISSLAELYRLDPLLEGNVEVVDSGLNGQCWIWQGTSHTSGYRGKGARYGKVKRNRKTWLIHRWAYRLMVGRIPDGYDVHHTCDSTLCLNPAHLEAIDHDEHTWLHNEEDSYAAAP